MRGHLLVALLVLLLHAASQCQSQRIGLFDGRSFSGSFTDFTTPVDDLQIIANFQDGTVHRYPAVQLWGDQFQPAPFVTAPLVLAGCNAGWQKGTFKPTDIDGCTATCPSSCPDCGWNYMNNSIAVVLRGNCYFSDKSRNAAYNGAVGIIIVDNIVEDTAHMAFAHVGSQLTIPTVIIGNSAGLQIVNDVSIGNTTVASILDSDEHSLKINVDRVVAGSSFFGSVEFRLTANSNTIIPFSQSYGKFPVIGIVDSQNNIKISPTGSWTNQPNAAMFQAKPFSLHGVLSTVKVGSSQHNVISGGIVGFDGISSYFTTREHSSSCFPELSFADVCQSAKRLFLCGGSNQSQVCAVATDSSGFRIFNDNTACPWGEPLLWYSTLDGPLEGQHVTLASVNENNGACGAGQRFAHPFITDWRGTLPALAQQYSGQGVTLTNSTSSWSNSSNPCADTTDPGVILAGGYLSFGTIQPTDVANRCNRSLTMTATLQDDGYLAFSHQSFGNWQCSYSPYWCGNLRVHVDGVQVYPDPRSYSWEVSSDWTVFRTGTIPKGNRIIMFSYVPPQYWYKPYPGTQPNIGAGIDSIILTGTVKAGTPGFCVSCPAGTCSDYGSSACNPCPLGTYSSTPGRSTCSTCTNTKSFPYHAQWANIGETKGTCQFNCGPGYNMSLDSSTCVPNNLVCYLPAQDLIGSGGVFYGASLAMIKQCIQLYATPGNSPTPRPIDFPSIVARTINTTIEAYGQYSLLNSPQGQAVMSCLKNIQANQAQKTLGGAELDMISCFNLAQRAQLRYEPSYFIQQLATYLPFGFDLIQSSRSNGKLELIIAEINAPATNFGAIPPLGQDKQKWSPTTYLGWKVNKICNGTSQCFDPLQFIQDWADVNIPAPDPGARLMAALRSGSTYAGYSPNRGDWLNDYTNATQEEPLPPNIYQMMSGQSFCSFTFRPLAFCDIRQDVDLTFQLTNPAFSGIPSTVTIPFTGLWDDKQNSIQCSNDAKDYSMPYCSYSWTYGHIGNTIPWQLRDAQGGTVGGGAYNCGSQFYADLDEDHDFIFPPAVEPDLTQYELWAGSNSDFVLSDMSSVRLIDSFSAATGFVVTTNFSRFGLLQVREFYGGDEMALHLLLEDMAAANVDRIVVDVRGNPGGSRCHAIQLVYLLTNFSGTSECQPWKDCTTNSNQALYQFRQSALQNATIMSSFTAGGSVFQTDYADLNANWLTDASWYQNGQSVKFDSSSLWSSKVMLPCDPNDSILDFTLTECSDSSFVPHNSTQGSRAQTKSALPVKTRAQAASRASYEMKTKSKQNDSKRSRDLPARKIREASREPVPGFDAARRSMKDRSCAAKKYRREVALQERKERIVAARKKAMKRHGAADVDDMVAASMKAMFERDYVSAQMKESASTESSREQNPSSESTQEPAKAKAAKSQSASADPSSGAPQSSTSDIQWWELQYNLRTRQRQVFDWKHLSILSDGRCIGACSLFTMMLQRNYLASTFLVGPTQIASHSPSGVSQRLSRQYCQWYNGALGFPGSLDYNVTSSNPSYPAGTNVLLSDLYLPLVGQDTYIVVAEPFLSSSDPSFPNLLNSSSQQNPSSPAPNQDYPASLMPCNPNYPVQYQLPCDPQNYNSNFSQFGAFRINESPVQFTMGYRIVPGVLQLALGPVVQMVNTLYSYTSANDFSDTIRRECKIDPVDTISYESNLNLLGDFVTQQLNQSPIVQPGIAFLAFLGCAIGGALVAFFMSYMVPSLVEGYQRMHAHAMEQLTSPVNQLPLKLFNSRASSAPARLFDYDGGN